MAQIKEQVIILTLAAFSLSFLCCRDLGSIPAVYVGVNSMRGNIVTTSMYYAGTSCIYSWLFATSSIHFIYYFIVYPELSFKLNKANDYYLFCSLLCWLLSNTLTAYAMYFDSSIIRTLSFACQMALLVPFVYCLFRWFRITAKKQNVNFLQFDRLTTGEYAALTQVLPVLCSSVVNLLYAVSSGELSWRSRTEQGLLVHFAFIYAVHLTLIRKFTLSSA